MKLSSRFVLLPSALCFALGLGLFGCSVDNSSPAALNLRNLDFNDFACNVQPVLAARCSMLACHGQANHALRLYTPGKLRIDQQTTLDGRDSALRLAEAMANFASARGIAPDDGRAIEDTPLLHKPLAPQQGGGEHKGGVIFHDPTDPGYQAIHDWITGTTSGGCPALDMLNMNP